MMKMPTRKKAYGTHTYATVLVSGSVTVMADAVFSAASGADGNTEAVVVAVLLSLMFIFKHHEKYYPMIFRCL